MTLFKRANAPAMLAKCWPYSRSRTLNGRSSEKITAIQDLVDLRDLSEVCSYATFIHTFLSSWATSTGHVLTRIVQKGADALGTLKDYDRELEVLEALLSQRRWRRGRRGKWYERRALVLTRYCDKTSENLRCAMRGLLDSLNDQDTHLGECARLNPNEIEAPITPHVVYRPSLSRRLTALEKKMGINPEERHQDDPLSIAEDVYITGVRLRGVHAASELPLATPAEAKQSALPFPVVKPKARQVAPPTTGVLGVRMIVWN